MELVNTFGGVNQSNMSALFVLIGISLIVALIFLVGFIWSVRSGQYDDDYTPSVRMLFENEPPSKEKTIKKIK